MLIFSLGYVSPCWYSHWSCIRVLIITAGDISHYWCSNLVSVGILTWSSITVFLRSLGHLPLCWYWHLVMYLHVDNHTCSCILCYYSHLVIYPLLLFLHGRVLLFCSSHLDIWSHFDIHTWSYISVFTVIHIHIAYVYILTFHIYHCWYSYLVMNTCVVIFILSCIHYVYSNFVMYPMM